MAAIAATLLAAGTVAALGSNHFAFAWKDYKKREYKEGRDGSQYNKCIVVGNDGFKKSDGYKERADILAAPTSTPKITPTPTPGTDGNGGGISDNSCNNYDGDSTHSDGVIKVPGNDGREMGQY
jgi:hypothetical protein